jgi:hypothetical protein
MLIEKDRRKIQELGRPARSVLRVHLHLQRKPIISIATAEPHSLSAPTVAKALQHIVKLGMVRETTGKQRHRLSGLILFLTHWVPTSGAFSSRSHPHEY